MSQIKPELCQVTCLSTLVRSYLKYLLCTLSIRFIQGPAAAKSLQLCLTLCDPIDGSPPGSPVPGILQARTLEWVAISFSNAWKWKRKVKSLSCIGFFMTPWTVAYQAPPSMGFSRQEYWSGLPLPSPYTVLGRLYLKLRFQLQKGKKNWDNCCLFENIEGEKHLLKNTLHLDATWARIIIAAQYGGRHNKCSAFSLRNSGKQSLPFQQMNIFATLAPNNYFYPESVFLFCWLQ